ncbi:MAG: deoxyribodipyrimidine photo-lyase, partial [Syntrophothermus sp.]
MTILPIASGMVDERRILPLNNLPPVPGPVVYWMSRDQRARDNWALLYASQMAFSMKQPLVVVFCQVPEYLQAQAGHFDFMLAGLTQVKQQLASLNIPFYLLKGQPELTIPPFLNQIQAGMLITDFNPLKINQQWKQKVGNNIAVAFSEVDAHNILPCRFISQKAESNAYHLRLKIQKVINIFLKDFPELPSHPFSIELPRQEDFFKQDRHEISGERAALLKLQQFLDGRLKDYGDKRNHPEYDAQSGLSPYLHFGQISAQRVAIEVQKHENDTSVESKYAFLEELIVRKELSDNFCLYNPHYDSFEGFPSWAKKTLNEHRNDARKYLYDLSSLKNAETHDPAWNT